MSARRTAVIIGAGPAGLTAAYELLHRTDILPVIYELTEGVGGICRTVNYKGNRMDIGGHRFFSKSDRVMDWWQNILPLQGEPGPGDGLVDVAYRKKKRRVTLSADGPDPDKTDKVMLLRRRRSSIFAMRRFFAYPLSLNAETVLNLGPRRLFRIGLSYLRARLFPVRPERTLRDFLINRFGLELYFIFFRSYTRKVWGVPCSRIQAEWGAQRIKGLSLSKALVNALTRLLRRDAALAQKGTETTLIERFLYPKYGPGQMWDEVARIVVEKGGRIEFNHGLSGLRVAAGLVTGVEFKDARDGRVKTVAPDFVFSTAPVSELIESFGAQAPEEVAEVARGLVYRDFVTIGVLLRKTADVPADTWIYVQQEGLKVSRIQIFNNWSPYLVKDKDTVWIGMEYFCNEGDALWNLDDGDFKAFAARELSEMGMAAAGDVLDSTLVRMRKTYPAYFGSYGRFERIRRFTDGFENLFLIGRNGMHRYNNQDHSMLTAMVAVDSIIAGVTSKASIWSVNTEQEHHEDE